jgi:hypothetical protein
MKCSNYISSQKNNSKFLLNNGISVLKNKNKNCLHLWLTMFIGFDYIINQEPYNLRRLRSAVTKQNKQLNIHTALIFNTIIYTMLNKSKNNIHAQRGFYPPRGK